MFKKHGFKAIYPKQMVLRYVFLGPMHLDRPFRRCLTSKWTMTTSADFIVYLGMLRGRERAQHPLSPRSSISSLFDIKMDDVVWCPVELQIVHFVVV